jgi:alanine racemase
MLNKTATFYRDTWVEVNLDCIYDNVHHLSEHLPSTVNIIAVVKANGYGHGAVNVAKTALSAGADKLAVALLDEAILLRKAGITAPILVMGWIRPEDARVAANFNITLTAFQMEWFCEAAKVLDQTDTLSFHLKFDTGMGRIGLKEKVELEQIVEVIKNDSRFYLDGVFTHFATADEIDRSYFDFQYERFKEMLNWLGTLFFLPKTIHCANSATALRFPNHSFSAVRFGISMYGLSPSQEIKAELPFRLKQAFSLHSRIVHVKKLTAGEKISYGGTYEAKEEEWIGTLPLGYADGWLRKLSGADVLVNGERCKIVGRICMDQCMVRLPYKVAIGAQATLIGTQGNEQIPVDEIAQKLETINYEIPCMISYRVPRMIFREKRIIEVEHYFDNEQPT